MKYRHQFTVRANLESVAAFHAHSRSMGAITPPPIVVQMHSAPEVLQEGDEMVFTLWALLFPLRWQARIEDVSPQGFSDRQLRGPFNSWSHRHSYHPISTIETAVVDEIEASLKSHPFWWLVGLGMWLGMPLLFAYRGWKTRQILEK